MVGRRGCGCAGDRVGADGLDPRRARLRRSGLTVTTRIDRWQRPEARLLLAEAFVSGTGKPVPVALDQYATDAAAAGKEFVRRLNNDRVASDVRCAPATAVNLLAASTMWAGLTIDDDELRCEVLVVKVMPVPAP